MTKLLEVSGVNVAFGGLKALTDVNFDLAKGEILGLIGPNGAGKTTLFSTLVGMIQPKAGEIRLCGELVTGRRPNHIARRGMTKTFQNTALFSGLSLVENVMIPAVVHSSVKEAHAIAEDCLSRVGMLRHKDRLVDDLTFPQKALAEIARSLATRPKVLLLDEVMASLTPAEMTEVIEQLRSLSEKEGIALVVVEHHMRAIMSLCHRILVLNFGQVIATGSPAEVSSDPRVLKAYLGEDYAAA